MSKSNIGRVRVFLVPIDDRDFSGEQFAGWWREETGTVLGMESLIFETDKMGPPSGAALDFELSHRDKQTLEAAAAELALALADYPASKDIDDGFASGKPQLDFKIRPEAYSLGLTPADVGTQVRTGFFGAEALRLQRGRDEVKVMVRLPESERKSELTVEDMLVRTPARGEIPLKEAATVVRGRAYTEIKRMDGRRILNVTAEMPKASDANQVTRSIVKNVIPDLKKRYPGLSYAMGGEQKELKESMSSLFRGFYFALMIIFLMLGVIFRSYIQPIVIMVAIPFGIVGAVIGHVIMGFDLSLISMMGIAALSGVVINDTLVLIDFANRERGKGLDAFEAIALAGTRRFRPIILTTMTTFLGLSPMIFESSFQARMLVPMAISLGYGELFGTMIILLLVPCLYLIVEDVKNLFGVQDITQAQASSEPEPGGG